MYGFIVLKYSGKTEQLIARNALNAQNAVCAEGIQPTLFSVFIIEQIPFSNLSFRNI